MTSVTKAGHFGRAECYKMAKENLNEVFASSLKRNDMRFAKQFLRSWRDKLNLNQLDKEGNTLLHAACSQGQFEAVKLLVTAGADINIVNSKGLTNVHISAARLQSDITKYLLDSGADVMIYNKEGELPLDVASSLETAWILVDKMVSMGHKELVNDYLIPVKFPKSKQEKEEQLVTSDSFGSLQKGETKPTLSDEISEKSNEQVGCRYKLVNEDEDQKEKRKKEDGEEEIFQQQTRRYTFPSYLGFATQPPGSILKRSHSFTYDQGSTLPGVKEDEAEEKETKRCSNRTVTFPSDILCQMCIKDNDYHDLKRLILSDKITDLNKLYANGITALHLAVIEDKYKCAEVLIDCGADIEIRDPHGWTPLHAAIFAGNIRAVRVLCNKGADVCATTKCGETVFDLAVTDLIRKYLKMITVKLVMSGKRKYMRLNSY